jgi:GxxExxY protein
MEETKEETKNDLKNIFFHKIFEYSKEIHKNLGSGYKEHIYVSGMKYHLTHDQYNFQTEVIIPIMYQNIQLGYERADIIIYEPYKCVLEFKAQNSHLSRKEFIQIEKYLKNMSINYGILINFHLNNSLEFYLIERIVKKSESNGKESNGKESNGKEIMNNENETEKLVDKKIGFEEKQECEEISSEEVQEEFIYKNFTEINNLMKSIKIN